MGPVGPDRLEPTQVDRGGAGGEVLLVGLREGLGVAPAEDGADLLAVLRDHRLGEVVAPGAGRLGQSALEVGGVDVGDLVALGQVDDEVHPGGRGLVDADRELDGLAVQLLLEDPLELLADAGVVAVAGQVDEDRDVAAVGVAADEHPHRPPLAGAHRGLGHRRELVDRGVQQLVAGVGLEGVHQGLAGVAARVEAAALEDLLGLLADQRDPHQALGVGRAGEQAEEATLAVHLAVLVEGLHADVVEVRRTVHRRAGVGLGQHQQRLLARLRLHRVGQPAERLRHLLVGAQDAEAGPGDGEQVVVAVALLELVLAVAEEGEVLVGQPFEELGGLADLFGVERRRVAAQVGDDRGDLGVHLAPVLDGLPDVAEHALDVVDDRVGVLALRQPVDLHVHPRLTDRLALGIEGAVRHRPDRLEGAGDVPHRVEAGMDDDVHVAQLPGQLHGERVHEERHVVDHDLDHAVPAGRPAVLGQRRRGDPHLRGPLGAAGGELVVRRERAVDVHLAAVEEVLGRDVAVVGADQLGDLVVGRTAGALPGLGQADRLVDQLGLGLLGRGLVRRR